MTYASLTDGSLSEAIEIVEEFLDADLSLEDFGLHSFFNVELDVQHLSWSGDAESTEIRRITLSHL